MASWQASRIEDARRNMLLRIGAMDDEQFFDFLVAFEIAAGHAFGECTQEVRETLNRGIYQ